MDVIAQRRMFDKTITDSDTFIELSSSTQALYFHLNQGADDDGFNNQIQNAMFKAHASVDDLKILLLKNFIIKFESGVIVIKHWRMHNYIRKDTYNETSFKKEKEMLKLEGDKTYSLSIEDTRGRFVDEPSTQVSIDKVSIDKYSIDNILSSKLDEEDDFEEVEIDKNATHVKIIDYLNSKCNTNYRSSTKKTRTLINARLREGYSEEDFKNVIDKKARQWLKDKEMCKFLRPETLFGNKFEGYLNEPEKELTTKDIPLDLEGW